MGETVKVRTKYQVTIPEVIRKKISLKIGSRVEVTARGSEIVIRPVVEIPKDQAWFWKPEWQEMEKRASEDEKKGKTKTFNNVEEAIKWLKS
ncbi:MAG: AbrB/MazE/SpoVT family DNA-binding domain-containing protein [Firmicutes bacterium]|nr:AbrB/MazE/SpoVT family DNA-binding domain-containing protein [Bacillota bacterium]